MSDINIIIWIQQFSTPFLDSFFKAVTFLGDEEYYVLTIPLVFWLFNKKFALRFAIFFLLNAYLNSILKHTFDAPRPPIEVRKVEVSGYSFPSGHAQGNTSFWGYLAVKAGSRWVYGAAAVLFSLVAFSRVYLGVHYPRDIIVGILVGMAWIAVYEYVARKVKLNLTRGQWFLFSIPASALLLIIPPGGDGPFMGFILGALWGYRLEEDFVGCKEKGYWWQQIIKAVLGITVLVGLYLVLSMLFMPMLNNPDAGVAAQAMAFVRYFVMGLWVTLGAPWLFQTLKLERPEKIVT